MPRTTLVRLAFASMLAVLAAPARAQLCKPGSLLVYPEYDTRAGHATVITVTNTEPGGFGPVLVHFNYVDASNCLILDRRESLTPNDTFTVNVSIHNPQIGRGFVYLYAERLSPQDAIAFNYLIGTVTHVDGVASAAYTMNAISYPSPGLTGTLTDLDLDDVRDLDGIEYETTPDVLQVPRFVGQSQGFVSNVVLVSLSGTAFKNLIRFTVFNDNEQVFTADYRFRCWAKPPLASVSAVFANSFLLASSHDTLESVNGNVEAGWFTIDGVASQSSAILLSDPAFLAVLIDPPGLPSSELPFAAGTQSNGDLISYSPLGDM